MRPTDSPRGFDVDGSSARSGPMSGQTLLNWGTCRTEMNIMLVAAIFLTLGLGLLLYLETMAMNEFGQRDAAVLFAILPAMSLFLYMGVVMVVVSLFIGGAPTESGSSGWSLGTRVCFLAFLLSVEGMIYLSRTEEMSESTQKLFYYLFGGLIALVVVFWSLYQRAVAKWVGLNGTAVATFPFLILGVAIVGFYVYITLEELQLIRRRALPGALNDRATLMMISTIGMIVLAIYQAILAGVIRSGITQYVLRNMPR